MKIRLFFEGKRRKNYEKKENFVFTVSKEGLEQKAVLREGIFADEKEETVAAILQHKNARAHSLWLSPILHSVLLHKYIRNRRAHVRKESYGRSQEKKIRPASAIIHPFGTPEVKIGGKRQKKCKKKVNFMTRIKKK